MVYNIGVRLTSFRSESEPRDEYSDYQIGRHVLKGLSALLL